MSTWIKICGNTSIEDAVMAAEAGADALGFVFAPSPRRVGIAQVKAIVNSLPALIEKIGVFVDCAADQIEAAVQSCGLTGIQLQWDVEPELSAELRNRLGPGTRILRVVHFGPQAAVHRAFQDTNVDGLLVDSRTAIAVGGTGIPFDWDSSRELFRDPARRMVVAGGLTPVNVSAAIGKLRPWGVDVVSGVESEPGRKDPEKVRSFISAARSAGRP
jgi:phosphoribosylanthranilate isomerase